MQLEMGMSTRRYLPARGTAGLARSLVKGKSRLPAPPPIITDKTLLMFGDMRLPCVIKKKPFVSESFVSSSITYFSFRTQAAFCAPRSHPRAGRVTKSQDARDGARHLCRFRV